jgi:ABC-type transport system substrate-binding protein
MVDKIFKNDLIFNKKDYLIEQNLNDNNLNLLKDEKILNDPLELNFIIKKSDDTAYKIYEYIKNDWLTINPLINLNLILLENDEFQQRLANKNFEAIILKIPLNENNILKMFDINNKFNLKVFENKTLNQYLNSLKKENNEENKKMILTKIKNILEEDNYFIFLFKIPYYYIFYNKINNVFINEIQESFERFQNIKEWYIFKAKIIK